ncbi:uncharacterized protein LOC117108091 [Anneissia japonica]|uniref:uncharacterized protein LOC117108091 n=1 Tax=Anneissia japonica TaxID=1529436 RepID=UPI00142558E3|nr:uncharacterized protein LOC117108091 [Anneissia japonica]
MELNFVLMMVYLYLLVVSLAIHSVQGKSYVHADVFAILPVEGDESLYIDNAKPAADIAIKEVNMLLSPYGINLSMEYMNTSCGFTESTVIFTEIERRQRWDQHTPIPYAIISPVCVDGNEHSAALSEEWNVPIIMDTDAVRTKTMTKAMSWFPNLYLGVRSVLQYLNYGRIFFIIPYSTFAQGTKLMHDVCLGHNDNMECFFCNLEEKIENNKPKPEHIDKCLKDIQNKARSK